MEQFLDYLATTFNNLGVNAIRNGGILTVDGCEFWANETRTGKGIVFCGKRYGKTTNWFLAAQKAVADVMLQLPELRERKLKERSADELRAACQNIVKKHRHEAGWAGNVNLAMCEIDEKPAVELRFRNLDQTALFEVLNYIRYKTGQAAISAALDAKDYKLAEELRQTAAPDPIDSQERFETIPEDYYAM